MSPLVVSAGAGFAAWSAQRVEVYTLLPDAHGRPLMLPDAGPGPDVADPSGAGSGGVPVFPPGVRIPGVVLAHGENPRDAALRALRPGGARDEGAAGGPDSPDAGSATIGATRLTAASLRLRQVLSDVRPQPGHPGLHVLRLVFQVVGTDDHPALTAFPPGPDPVLLHDPAPAWVTDPVPGAPPRVQRPAAYAVVVREGEALLTRLAGHGVWTLPGGGIDHGEHPDDAVRRETFEETGLDLLTARLVDVDSRHFTGRSPAQVTEDFHGVRIRYRGTVADGRAPEVQEIGGSTDAAAWFPLDRLPELRLTDVARTALQRVR